MCGWTTETPQPAPSNQQLVRALLRRLPPHRRDRPPRPRHPPLRPHEARRPNRPQNRKWPYAVVQLRQENLRADSYNLVGFQNHLKFGEQKRVLSLIPGLENATFLRYGQIHRNTYINAPTLLTETLQLRAHPTILIAGQLSGVEGYTESIASGLLAGRYAAALAQGEQPTPAPRAQRQRQPDPLHHPRRIQTLPTRQHHLRPPPTPRNRAPQKDPRQKRTPPPPVQPSPRSLEHWLASSQQNIVQTEPATVLSSEAK